MSQKDRDETAAVKKGGRFFRSQLWDRTYVVLGTVTALVTLIAFLAPLVGKLRSPDSVTAATESATTSTSVPPVDATTPDTAEPSTTTPATTAAATTSPPTTIAPVPATTLKQKSTSAATVPAATAPAPTVAVTTAPAPTTPAPTTPAPAAAVLMDVKVGNYDPATLSPPVARCTAAATTVTLVWNLQFAWAVSDHLAADYSVLYRRVGEIIYSTALDVKNGYAALHFGPTSPNPAPTDPLRFTVGLKAGETAKSAYSLEILLKSSTDKFEKTLGFACPTK